ncbi:hypothetical protein [Catenuloplanes japonicus]|uniref:hypothetical protein n=1 Tax=Catenuloplanes japonicus TaxID=33876 RepID=UPI00068FF180|nr:hypothetical protein [Catenuloplanes japonicus]
MILPRIRPAVPVRRPAHRPAAPDETIPRPAPPSLVTWAESRPARPDPDPTGDPTTGTPMLLPLAAHRRSPAEIWAAVAPPDSPVTAILDLPEPEITAAVRALTRARIAMFARVDLEFGDRPVTALVEALDAWSRHPVSGLFLDRCPAEPDDLGITALAVRHAHRLGITEVLLNVGTDPHPRYRCLGAGVVGFAGSWHDYQRAETRPGDGHLVFEVPVALLPLARRLIGLRGAGWALATPVARPQRVPQAAPASP